MLQNLLYCGAQIDGGIADLLLATFPKKYQELMKLPEKIKQRQQNLASKLMRTITNDDLHLTSKLIKAIKNDDLSVDKI